MKKIAITIIIIFLSVNENLYSQSIGFDFGLIKNFQSIEFEDYAIPVFITFGYADELYSNKIEGESNISYWTDFKTIEQEVSDFIFYSFESFIILARLKYKLKNLFGGFKFPVKLISGVSNHYYWGNNLSEYVGDPKSINGNFFYMDFGIQLFFEASEKLSIQPEAVLYIPLNSNKSKYIHNEGRFSFSIGL